MPLPAVSVIVPVYNSQATIRYCLLSLLAQEYGGELQVVVVDDGSTDNTPGVVRAFPGVQFVRQRNAGPAAARNRGAELARGEILLFTDSDCVPMPGWVHSMVAGFTGEEVGCVAGSYGNMREAFCLARIIHGEIRFRHCRLMPDYVRAFGSYNVAIRRELFSRLGGFDTTYRRASGEDNDLSYRIIKAGAKIRFLKEALVYHFHQNRLPEYLREQYRHGIWRARMYMNHPGMAAGDGYTFWKDIIEVPAAYVSAAMFFWPPLGAGFCLLFLLFELLAGVYIFSFQWIGIAAGGVFFLRSYARAAGFLVGSVIFHVRSLGR